MGRFVVFFLLFLVFFYGIEIYPQNQETDSGVKIPPGMEIRKVGDVNVLMPKGAKMEKRGGVILLENTDQYAAQKFMDIETRLTEIETNLEELERKITSIEDSLKRLEKSTMVMEKTNE